MKSHDILEVKETATKSEIDQAFTVKKQVLDGSKALLSTEGYVKKLVELEKARDDCLNWFGKSRVAKISSRLGETITNGSNDVRLYTPCIGPVTMIDGFCGYCCDITGSETDHSICVQACNGSQACPICLDIGVWGFAALMIYLKWKEKHEINMRIQRRERADRAMHDNVHLDAQLGTCKQEEKDCRDKIAKEQEIVNKVNAFSSLFVSLGANPATELIAEQNRRIDAQNKKIADIKQREDGIRGRIRDNDRLIAEANNDN